MFSRGAKKRGERGRKRDLAEVRLREIFNIDVA